MSNTPKNQLDKETCQRIFDYDDELGCLRWKEARGNNKIAAGSIAGRINARPYIRISLGHKEYGAHTLIWNWHRGLVPAGKVVDHRIGRKQGGTDHINNLQLLTDSENTIKSITPKINGTSPFIGVTWSAADKKWRAGIGTSRLGGGREQTSAFFDDEIEAAEYYDFLAIGCHGFWAQLNFPELDPYWFNYDNPRLTTENRLAMQRKEHFLAIREAKLAERNKKAAN